MKQKRDPIHNLFVKIPVSQRLSKTGRIIEKKYDSKCSICDRVVPDEHAANLKRHFVHNHEDTDEFKVYLNESKQYISEKKKADESRLKTNDAYEDIHDIKIVEKSNFSTLNFQLIIRNRKRYALCLLCNAELFNTSQKRLESHRRKCKLPSSSTSTTSKNEGLASRSNLGKRKRDSSYTTSLEMDQDYDDDDDDDDAGGDDDGDGDPLHADADGVLETDTYPIVDIQGIQIDVDDASSALYIPQFSSTTNSDTHTSYTYCNSQQISEEIATVKPSSSFRSTGKRSSALNYVAHMTEKDISIAHERLEDFIFGCNIPFSVVESTYFIEFVKCLNPTYAGHLPNRNSLSSKHLEAAYERCSTSSTAFRDEETVILLEGWKGGAGATKNVVALLHNSQGERAFLDTWNCTNQELRTIVKEAKNIASSRYQAEAYAVVIDSGYVDSDIQETDLWYNTCNCYTAKALVKDTVDMNLKKQVFTLLEEFNRTDLQKLITDSGGSSLQLPCDTKLSSVRDVYVSFINNFSIMRTIVWSGPGENIDENVKALLESEQFVNDVKDSIELIDPICTIIDVCENQSSSIADAVDLWLNLKIPAKFENLKPHYEFRKNMALSKYAVTAYFLHPAYYETAIKLSKSEDLEERTQYIIALNFLMEHLDAEGLEAFDNFITRKGIFKTLLDKGVVQPLVFWRIISPFHSALAKLATKLLKLPASTAHLEGSFVQWSKEPKRNRMTADKSEKLLHVYYSLKMKDKLKCEDY